MTDPDIHVPPEGPPRVPMPSREIHAAMGEAAVVQMCRDFYAELETSPIRHLFAEDMARASEHIASYLVEIFGGPPRFSARFGPPMMRARHLRFAITPADRDVWLSCFRAVLADAPARYGFPAEHLPGFLAWLEGLSAWMVNRPPPGRAG